jgi:hypothetical protein
MINIKNILTIIIDGYKMTISKKEKYMGTEDSGGKDERK